MKGISFDNMFFNKLHKTGPEVCYTMYKEKRGGYGCRYTYY